MKKESKTASFFGMNKFTRTGMLSAIVTLILLAAVILLNALTSLIPYRIAKPDVTGSEVFELSGTTRDWLRALDTDATLYLICKGGKANADGDIYGFLLDYAKETAHVTAEVVDPSVSPDFITAYGGEWPDDKSMIVKSDARYRVINYTDLFYYYNSNLDMTMTPEEYESALGTFTGDYASYLSFFIETTTAYFDGESLVTNAINFVTCEDVPVVYTLSGGNGSSDLDSTLKSRLGDAYYETKTLLSLENIPKDCDILVINAPSADLSENEAETLSAYLEGGKDLLLTTYYATQKLPVLESVLAEYGLGFENTSAVVGEGDTAYVVSDAADAALFYAHILSKHDATGAFDSSFVLDMAHAIKLTETDGVTLTPWLYTSELSYLMTYDTDSKEWKAAEEKAAYNVGVIAEKDETSIIWLSSPHALTSYYNAAYADGGNFALAVSALNWMSGSEAEPVFVEAAAIDSSMLSVTGTQFAVWGIILVIIIPLSVALVGVLVWYARKKR